MVRQFCSNVAVALKVLGPTSEWVFSQVYGFMVVSFMATMFRELRDRLQASQASFQTRLVT